MAYTYSESFETSLAGWSGDGAYHSSTGGLNGTGYKGGQRSSAGPYHVPAQPPAADALLGDVSARFGPGVRFSYWLKVIGGTQTGSPQFYLFSGNNIWGFDLGAHDFSQWTHVLFEVDTTWSDAEAKDAGWYNEPWNGGSFADAWANVTYYNFFSTGGSGTVDTGIDEVVVESSSPWNQCGQSFDEGLAGWIGGANDGAVWIPAGGADDTGYHQSSLSGAYPAHEPWEDPDRSVFTAQLAATYGHVLKISYYVKDFSETQPGTGRVLHAFIDPAHGNPYTRWELPISPTYPTTWTQVSFVIDTDWSDAEAVSAGWRRTVGTGSWIDLFEADGLSGTNAGLRSIFGTSSGQFNGLRVTGLDCPAVGPGRLTAGPGRYGLPLTITSPLPFPKVPMDPTIDFSSLMQQAGVEGVLDPNSITVVDVATGQAVPHALENFQYGDSGRIEWVIEDPTHLEYEIFFNTVVERTPLLPARYTPMIGVGDLLRYNAGVPRPICPIDLWGLYDVNGDEKADLVGTWNYWYRPGEPKDGVVFYPRVGSTDEFLFGDMLRFVPVPNNHTQSVDVNGDSLLDVTSLAPDPTDPGLSGYDVTWQRSLQGGGHADSQILTEVDDHVFRPVGLAGVNSGPHQGLLVLHHNWERVAFFESSPDQTQLQYFAQAESLSAPLILSDQAWPYPCDWDDDGDWDLLVGGGYGWPRIVLNEGTNDQPAFAEARYIYSQGQPIRILMSQVFYPGCDDYAHDMGYPYPAYVDWDHDGLPDLMLPNCSNRIFWYKNIGTRRQPAFGPRQQVLVDGYPDTPEIRAADCQRLMASWEGYLDPNRPFYFRTGAAFADYNGDGLIDLITHDGGTRRATLFVQYDDGGTLRLRREGLVMLTNGQTINGGGWTESFDAIDWDADGLIDLVFSEAGKSGDTVFLFRNAGTPLAPVFEPAQPIRMFGTPIDVTDHGPHVGVADLDGDGRPEVIACVEWSVYPFYRGTALAMSQRPSYELGELFAASPLGDFDFDDDVDQDDFGHLQICLTGSFQGPPRPGCAEADLDNDGDVDQDDVIVFGQNMTGAKDPAP